MAQPPFPDTPDTPGVPSRPPGPHPTPEQLYRARRGPRTAEAERWLAHAGACATCTEELLLLEAFDEPDAVSPGRLAGAWERFGQPAARPRPPLAPPAALAPVIPINPISPSSSSTPIPPPRKQSRAPWIAALAASLAAVTVLSVWTSLRPEPSQLATPPPAVRGGSRTVAAAGVWLPAGTLDGPPSEIVFPAANGEEQRVTVFDADHSYTWTSPPAANGRVLFPAGERQRLRKGVDYYWTVIGQEEMEARSFRLR